MRWGASIRVGIFCIVITGVVQAASFSPVQEWTYCNSDALTRADIPEPNEFIDPQNEWGANSNGAYSSTYIDLEPDGYVVADTESMVDFTIESDGMDYTDNLLLLYSYSYSYVEISSPEGEEAYAWSGGATVDPGYATGNFYEIVPETGESVGDWVTVTVDYAAMLDTYSEGGSSNSVIVNGGFAGDDLLITRNCADYDAPQPGEIAHAFELKDSAGEYSDQISFSAQIGDVIGIHCGLSSSAYTGTNPGMADSSVDLNLTLVLSEGSGPELTAEDADIDGSGRVDLGDLAILAQFWLETVGGSNDDCSNAIELTLDVPVTGDNFGATGGPMDGCSDGADGKDVWYSFTAPSSNWYRIVVSMDNPDLFDSALSIWDACDGSEIDCNETYGDEEVQHYMFQDDTIYIRVAGYNGPYPDEGEFTIEVEPLLM